VTWFQTPPKQPVSALTEKHNKATDVLMVPTVAPVAHPLETDVTAPNPPAVMVVMAATAAVADAPSCSTHKELNTLT